MVVSDVILWNLFAHLLLRLSEQGLQLDFMKFDLFDYPSEVQVLLQHLLASVVLMNHLLVVFLVKHEGVEDVVQCASAVRPYLVLESSDDAVLQVWQELWWCCTHLLPVYEVLNLRENLILIILCLSVVVELGNVVCPRQHEVQCAKDNKCDHLEDVVKTSDHSKRFHVRFGASLDELMVEGPVDGEAS